nr:NADH dehydrogenase subunit 6 [Serichlamys sp. ECU1]
MMQLILYSLLFFNALLFTQMNHPLSMGLILLIQTILITCIMGMMSQTFWFSYILFLIFIGGMLILFIYVTSLASNEMFSPPKKMWWLLILLFMLIIIIINYMMDKTWLFNMNNNNEIKSLMNINLFMKENMLNLNKLYNYPTNMMTIMMINYLLLTMIATVKITKLFYGPIRSSF